MDGRPLAKGGIQMRWEPRGFEVMGVEMGSLNSRVVRKCPHSPHNDVSSDFYVQKVTSLKQAKRGLEPRPRTWVSPD